MFVSSALLPIYRAKPPAYTEARVNGGSNFDSLKILIRKEVECDGQGEDMKYWLKIEQVLPRMFYQISSSS